VVEEACRQPRAAHGSSFPSLAVPTLDLFSSDNIRRDAASHDQSFKGGKGTVPSPTRARSHALCAPDEPSIEVGRYEAHRSRGLYKVLHELEALQARRTGGAAPLARLDVDGLVGSYGQGLNHIARKVNSRKLSDTSHRQGRRLP
jgi:hypothetical protein